MKNRKITTIADLINPKEGVDVYDEKDIDQHIKTLEFREAFLRGLNSKTTIVEGLLKKVKQ